MKMNPNRGSHLPMLMRVVQNTSGPILELGSGHYSTIYLHWACYSTKRKLITYESKPDWYDFINLFKSDFHEVHCITNWDAIDISEPWSVALVDHSPDERRVNEVKRLTHADFVVIHDAEIRNGDKYKFNTAEHLFKYKYRYTEAYPHTSVWSNKYNFEKLFIPVNINAPSLDSFNVLPEKYLTDIAGLTGYNRPYTICIALAQIYKEVENSEIRLKLRYAATIAQYVILKLMEYNPTWMKQFYPRFKDFNKLMGIEK